MTTTGKNQIMIFGPKPDGTYVVEFRTAGLGNALTGARRDTQRFLGRTVPGEVRLAPIRGNRIAPVQNSSVTRAQGL
jgi:hypothetical protein